LVLDRRLAKIARGSAAVFRHGWPPVNRNFPDRIHLHPL
jgi:hypothetical protein